MSREGPTNRPDDLGDAPTPASYTFAFRSCVVVVLALLIFEGVVLGGTRFGWLGALLGPFVIYGVAVTVGLAWTLACFGLLSLDEILGRLAAKRKKRRGRGHPLADDEVDSRRP